MRPALARIFPFLAILLGACAAPVVESQAEPPVEGGWAFSYPTHNGSEKSRIDLRFLNEPIAGASGFVRLSSDGDDFVLGDGSPARFWAVGSEVYKQPTENLKKHVQFLAGIGVNMVRLHAQICPPGPNSNLTDVNEKEIDGIWRFVAEAKTQGIYVTISPYWAANADATRWGIEGIKSPSSLWGLLFFDETLQRGYKAWAAALYGRPNPYTSIPLAKDPAVAIIQVQNEDSLLFHTMMKLPPAQNARLGQKFAAWLAAKYGQTGAIPTAWASAKRNDDDFEHGRAGLFQPWEMVKPISGEPGVRASDQFHFLVESQRKFYADMKKFYREDLGCGQLINASNWKSANQALEDDSERWSYTATDVIAVNRYFNGGAHVGPNNGWRIDPGDKFSQRSALMSPRELPVNLKQVIGHPMILSESSWVTPNAFQSEGPFLVAVYESLTGVDAFFWFTVNAPDFKTATHFPYQKVKGQQPLMKWSASIPPILGGFPASALLFRKGYVKQGKPVVHEERTLQSMYDRLTPIIAEDPSFDPNRDKAPPVAPRPGEKATVVNPLAFLVGPVEVKYDGDPSKNRVVDLAHYIDLDKKMIRSITGEIILNYGNGLCTVDAPKAQGACGFLKQAGLIRLGTIAIRSDNAYATILVVPLDDKPLATSRKILIQVGTAARPTGWATKDAEFKGEGNKPTRGFEVINTGKPPWMIADTEIGFSIRNPGLTKATRLDPAGFPVEDVPLKKARTGVSLALPPDTMYLILE